MAGSTLTPPINRWPVSRDIPPADAQAEAAFVVSQPAIPAVTEAESLLQVISQPLRDPSKDIGYCDNLQVGLLTTIKTAGYIGNARIYHETGTILDQAVLFKEMTGTVQNSDLGRTWQTAVIQDYDAQLNSALSPVNVCAANEALTMNVGANATARGSAVNSQKVITIAATDNAFGANEYANTVQLIDPTLGQANSGNTIWGNDWTVNGAKDGADYRLYGTTQMICRYNTGAPTSGEGSVGHLVTTRPKSGAGSQNRSGLYTFPISIGIAVAGFSGLNDPATVNGAYAAGATNGFDVAFQAGGKLGPWLNDGSYPNGGSKLGSGFAAYDYLNYGFVAAAAHPSASGSQRSFYAATGSGHMELQTGTYNQDHLVIGGVHIWNNAGTPYFKNGVPANAADGTALGAAPTTQYVKAFCVGNSAGGFTTAGLNCSTATRTGAGAYTVAFTTTITNPVPVASAAGGFAEITAIAGGSVSIATFNSAGVQADMAYALQVMST